MKGASMAVNVVQMLRVLRDEFEEMEVQ